MGRRSGISIEQRVWRAEGTVRGCGKQADATSNVENAPTGRYGNEVTDERMHAIGSLVLGSCTSVFKSWSIRHLAILLGEDGGSAPQTGEGTGGLKNEVHRSFGTLDGEPESRHMLRLSLQTLPTLETSQS